MAYRYRLKNPKRAYSLAPAEDWRHETAFAVETDAGVVEIAMDKPGRALTLGVAQGRLLSPRWRPGMSTFDNAVGDGFFIFDRRIVAMVADLLMKHWKGGVPYPQEGEEMHLPTAEEADAIYAKYGIPTPQTNEETDRLLVESVEVGDDGRPLDARAGGR